MTDQKPREFFWVPEDCIFECASDCLGKFPDYGPACLVASHVAFDQARAEIAELKQQLSEACAVRDQWRSTHFKLAEAITLIEHLELYISKMWDSQTRHARGVVSPSIREMSKAIADFKKRHEGENGK